MKLIVVYSCGYTAAVFFKGNDEIMYVGSSFKQRIRKKLTKKYLRLALECGDILLRRTKLVNLEMIRKHYLGLGVVKSYEI